MYGLLHLAQDNIKRLTNTLKIVHLALYYQKAQRILFVTCCLRIKAGWSSESEAPNDEDTEWFFIQENTTITDEEVAERIGEEVLLNTLCSIVLPTGAKRIYQVLTCAYQM